MEKELEYEEEIVKKEQEMYELANMFKNFHKYLETKLCHHCKKCDTYTGLRLDTKSSMSGDLTITCASCDTLIVDFQWWNG